MTSSADGLMMASALALAPLPAMAQDAGSTVPAGVSAAVAAEIAGRWGVPTDAVIVEWPALPTAVRLADDTPVRLVGKGEHGAFIALLEPATGSSAAVKVRAGLLDTVMVATRALARGVTLESGDVAGEARVRWGAPSGRVARPGTGWVTRRTLATGDVVTGTAASAPQVVKAGEPVRIEWRHGSVAVVLDGVALNAASLGEPVRVRLAGRPGQRSGRATGPGAVSLGS